MEFWHICGRGVDKRDVVIDDSDRLRFIHNLYVFNDSHAAPNAVLHARHDETHKRELLVDIHAYCLMNNHYHLLVSERSERGMSLFMQKFNMGYTKYFNERYGRSGSLWQGKYRKVHIQRNSHFLYVPFYIHLNPLDYVFPEWRTGNVKKVERAYEALAKYRWSSHLDYSGIRNFPSVMRSDVLKEFLGSSKEQERTISSIIQSPDLLDRLQDLEFKN